MTLPEWAQIVLSEFEQTTVPHNEVQIAEALKTARIGKPDPGDEGWKAFLAEFSVFFFREAGEEHSIWKTYFAPMAILTKHDGTEVLNPDIAELDADSVAHWASRANSVTNPLMRARYADAVWDLGNKISGEKRRYACAILAIDSYIEAVRQKLYSMVNEEVQALRRALDLSLSLRDVTRCRAVAEAIFALYDFRFNPLHVSVWILPFDSFYEKDGILTTAQEQRLITDLENVLARTSGAGKPEEIDPFAAKEAAERLARHYTRLNDRGEVERVIKAYGSAFETLAANASPMLAMTWLQPVIERYEQEGLKGDAERLQNLSAEKGAHISEDLKEYSAEVEIEPQKIEDLTDALLAGDELKTILLRIAEYFVPSADAARTFLETMKNSAPLLSLIPIAVVGGDGRTTARIGSIEDDLEGRLLRQLGQTIGFYQPFLTHVLMQLSLRHHPTVDNILEALYDSPLFIESRRELLRDGVLAYEQEDFVKAIHVLVPQIEQVLRNFLVLLRIPPTKSVGRTPGVSDVKNMNDILRDDRVREAMTENLWRYLAVLYVEREGGFNVRNNLAHGLIAPGSLDRPLADCVFHSLLAISQIRAVSVSTTESPETRERTEG
jgi:Domain of unknown function (DUF4209)